MFDQIQLTSIRAIFLGKDGSMGLRHGTIYDIKIYSYGGYLCVDWGGKTACPYSSIRALSENWELAKGIK